MAARGKPIEIDTDLIARARTADGSSEKSDAEVIEDALAVYLGLHALEAAQALGGLIEHEADRVAAEEVRAVRRSRDAAA